MVIDGKKIAEDILFEVAKEVSLRQVPPRLAIVTIAPDFATQKYLAIKKQKAALVGIEIVVDELPATASTKEVLAVVAEMVSKADGVVVQLPLPGEIDVSAVLAAIPIDKDPDGFSYGEAAGTSCLPPVVAAIDEIACRQQIDFAGKEVLVLGAGRLVGRPAALYASARGAKVTVLTKENYDPSRLKSADIIISGVGSPRLITPDLVKEGVVIFDAGTAEADGVLVGDADPEVARKSSLFTPVPGGIGPITVACLLRNLLMLSRQ